MTQYDFTRPIYRQIMEEIKKRAVRGEYSPGQKVPSVREMAKEMQVNPNTLSRAYMELEREGFMFSLRGQGTFITQDNKRISQERKKLAELAVKELLAQIKSLKMDKEDIKKLLTKIAKDLK